MKISDEEIKELNSLIKKGKFDLPFNKRVVERHTGVYCWLQKNIVDRNADKLTPRIKELLDIS